MSVVLKMQPLINSISITWELLELQIPIPVSTLENGSQQSVVLLKYVYMFIIGRVGSLLATQAFSSCGERGYSLVAVHQLLIAVASPVAEHGL